MVEVGIGLLAISAIIAFIVWLETSTNKAVKREMDADAAAVARDLMEPPRREDR